MTFRCKDLERLRELITAWDIQQAHSEIMGYMGQRLLVERADPGRCVIVADFGVIDPVVSPADEAFRNDERPETQAGPARLRRLVVSEVEYREYDEIYRTDQ